MRWPLGSGIRSRRQSSRRYTANISRLGTSARCFLAIIVSITKIRELDAILGSCRGSGAVDTNLLACKKLPEPRGGLLHNSEELSVMPRRRRGRGPLEVLPR